MKSEKLLYNSIKSAKSSGFTIGEHLTLTGLLRSYLGFPAPGTWRLRLNSDWSGYSRAFGNQACSDVAAAARAGDSPQGASPAERDGLPAMGTIAIGPYSVLVFSQDPPVNQ
jgi:hypothetical protein